MQMAKKEVNTPMSADKEESSLNNENDIISKDQINTPCSSDKSIITHKRKHSCSFRPWLGALIFGRQSTLIKQNNQAY